MYTDEGRGITGGSSTLGQTGNMNKEEGNGYPRFFSSSSFSLLLKFSYTSSFRGGTLCLHDSRFLLFLIYSKISSLLYIFLHSLFLSSLSLNYHISFHFKKDYVSLFFFSFSFARISFDRRSIRCIFQEREFSSIEEEIRRKMYKSENVSDSQLQINNSTRVRSSL